MIEAKDSKELHFIKPKDAYRLKKLFSDFTSLLHDINQRINVSVYPTEYTISEEDGGESKN